MKKKLIALFVLTILLFTAAGCGGNTDKGFVWTGMADATVVGGDDFDPMQGITVMAGNTDITSKVRVLTYDDEELLESLGIIDDFTEFDHNAPGKYTLYYHVENGGKKETETREVTVQTKYNLLNGDFKSVGNTSFNRWDAHAPGGRMTVTKFNDNGKTVPKISISGAGNNWYALQYINNTPNMIKDDVYRITVRAKSATGKAIAFGFEDKNADYAMLKGLTVHKLTAEYATYESYFVAENNYNSCKAVLYMGRMLPTDKGNHEIVIDRINIEKITRCNEVEFDGLGDLFFDAGIDDYAAVESFNANRLNNVSITRNGAEVDSSLISVIGEVPNYVTENARHDVVYAVKAPNSPTAFAIRKVTVRVKSSATPYNVMNGDFSEDYDFWTQDVNADPPAKGPVDFSIEGEGENRAAKIAIANPGTDDWHIQLRQQVTLKARTVYTITVVIKAKNTFTPKFEMANDTKYPMALTGGEDYKTFEFEYTSSSTAGGRRLSFLLGGGATSGNTDNIYYIKRVEVAEGMTFSGEQYAMNNQDFDSGLLGWHTEGNAIFSTDTADSDKVVTITLNGMSYEADWSVQLRQDGKNFAAGKYRITVVATASVTGRKIAIEVPQCGEFKQTTTLTTEMATYTYIIDVNSAKTGVRVGMLLGQNDMEDSVVTVYQFKVEKIS